MAVHHHHHDLNEQFEEAFSGKRSDEEIIAHQQSHAHHHHDAAHPHVHGDTKDYMSAVNEYRKTFPDKQQQIEQTPDPAVREMLLHLHLKLRLHQRLQQELVAHLRPELTVLRIIERSSSIRLLNPH